MEHQNNTPAAFAPASNSEHTRSTPNKKSVALYKLRAAVVSLSVFLVMASVLAFVTYRYWFPHYLFWLDGGMQGLRLVYAVDFVLGPLLTLVFFHPNKSRNKLVFDIVVIAAVQISAMAWGAHQVYGQRPIAVVYGTERFISVAPQIIQFQNKTSEDMKAFSNDAPPFVYRRETTNAQEKGIKLGMLMQKGFHFESQVWLFQPYQENLDKIFIKQTGYQGFVRDELLAAWQTWSAEHGQKPLSDYRFVLYEGRYNNGLLIFNPAGVYQGYLDLPRGSLPYIRDVKAEKSAQ